MSGEMPGIFVYFAHASNGASTQRVSSRRTRSRHLLALAGHAMRPDEARFRAISGSDAVRPSGDIRIARRADSGRARTRPSLSYSGLCESRAPRTSDASRESFARQGCMCAARAQDAVSKVRRALRYRETSEWYAAATVQCVLPGLSARLSQQSPSARVI